MTPAITRAASPAIGRCELTHLEREPIDVGRACASHAACEDCLRQAGCAVLQLPGEPEMPDSVFVEDTAIVLDELALVTRPGSESRRRKTVGVAAAYPRTRARLEARGVPVTVVEVPELAGAEGALTCCSLIVEG